MLPSVNKYKSCVFIGYFYQRRQAVSVMLLYSLIAAVTLTLHYQKHSFLTNTVYTFLPDKHSDTTLILDLVWCCLLVLIRNTCKFTRRIITDHNFFIPSPKDFLFGVFTCLQRKYCRFIMWTINTCNQTDNEF